MIKYDVYALMIRWRKCKYIGTDKLKIRVIIVPTLLSLAFSQVVIITTCDSAIDGKVGIMTTFKFSVFFRGQVEHIAY